MPLFSPLLGVRRTREFGGEPSCVLAREIIDIVRIQRDACFGRIATASNWELNFLSEAAPLCR